MPMTIYDTLGNPVWDTDTVAGGVLADVRTYAAASTATLTYPVFPGRQVIIVPLLIGSSAAAMGVSTDTALGYPRVTVSAGPATRRFSVMVI